MQTSLERELADARCRTDELFQIVDPRAIYERPIAERHRIIFYLGHLEAFDWNLLGRYALDLPQFHSSFDRLFAFGIDPEADGLPSDQPSDWPGVAEVEQYGRRTREVLDESIANIPDKLLHAAIEHRLMHAETLAYILHHLPSDSKLAPLIPPLPRAQQPESRFVDIPAGVAKLGRTEEEGFGWDNEYQANSALVPAFTISKYKVTNGEYLEFVREGGLVPYFWIHRDSQWFYRGMFGDIPLPDDWPVYVTKCQAEEYARWRGGTLPTEAQFHRAAAGVAASTNTDFRFWDPIPVTGDHSMTHQPAQLTGNGWEWTSTVFGPFPGFEPFPFYENYSAPFFDGAHYVLKGGSPRTAARLLRPSFRNWFRPSYPYIYATFRLVGS